MGSFLTTIFGGSLSLLGLGESFDFSTLDERLGAREAETDERLGAMAELDAATLDRVFDCAGITIGVFDRDIV